MKLYFAGTENKINIKMLKQHNVKNILQSAFYLKYSICPNYEFKNVLIDSGGFTARKQKVPIDVIKYADFLNKFKIKLAINLDTINVKETLDNQKYLLKHTKTKIIPVYHLSDYLDKKDLIYEFIDKFDYISLGGMAELSTKPNSDLLNEFFRFVFSKTKNEIKVHGLAITNQKLLELYPWYSVDSTSWLSPGQYGQFKTIKDIKMKIVLRRKVKYSINTMMEIPYWLKLEKYITELWKKRGVTWRD